MPTVTVYSTNTCGYCGQLKKFLGYKGIKYSEVNLDDHPEKIKEVHEMSGVYSVPVTHIKNGAKEAVVIGLNIPNLLSALA